MAAPREAPRLGQLIEVAVNVPMLRLANPPEGLGHLDSVAVDEVEARTFMVKVPKSRERDAKDYVIERALRECSYVVPSSVTRSHEDESGAVVYTVRVYTT